MTGATMGGLHLRAHLIHFTFGWPGEDGSELANLLLIEAARRQSHYVILGFPQADSDSSVRRTVDEQITIPESLLLLREAPRMKNAKRILQGT